MARQYRIVASQAGVTPWTQVEDIDTKSNLFSLNLTISESATATVEFANFSSLLNPIEHPDMAERKADTFGVVEHSVQAFRVNVTSYTSGDVVLEIMQGRRV